MPMQTEGEYDLSTGAGLTACPRCDALHVERELEPGETARCLRCNTLLASPRAGAFTRIIALSFASLVLMVGRCSFRSWKSRAWGSATRPRFSAWRWPFRTAP
ncbi:paraquat-inducible protein A [Paracoccus pantotrophus]|uniref:hypothetical protein n=1 Tax=Paracoccus pantotrophus TaxID=82367 RepID=UPI001FCCB6DB|nr:hypothetical protein [Paracoccus pantotrophus]